MLIFYLLLLFIPLFLIKKKTDDKIMDPYSTTCIKGIVCLYVVLHNLGLDYKGNSEIIELVCEHTGGIGVGIFFFLSAFGIIRSYQLKGNKYFKRLMFSHILKLYIIAVCINALTYFVFCKGQFETTDTIMRVLNLDLLNGFKRINRHGWYIATIIFLYLIFMAVYYLCSKLKTEKKFIIAGLILAFISVFLRILAHIADTGGMYTREIPCFAIGCIYATFFDQINAFFKKNFKLSFILLFIAFWIGFFFWEPLGSYASCLFIILISQKIDYRNKVTFYIGKMCIYFYLFVHFAQLRMQPFVTNQYWWVLTCFGLILELTIASYAIEQAVYKIINLIKEKRKKLTV